MTQKVILFGATGMIGEGVLHMALQQPDIEKVLVVGRRACGKDHPKLSEEIIPDLFELSAIQDRLAGYDACYFCAGVSSMGMSEDEYRRLTHEMTLSVGRLLKAINPGMTFCYVSGEGTDSSEKGRLMWARVKGKTENDLLALFEKAYMFRPGFIRPIKGLKNTLKPYKYLAPFFPLIMMVFKKHVCTLEDLGKAMIRCGRQGFEKNVLENVDIARAAV